MNEGLVARAQEGDEQAFTRVAVEIAPRLHAVAYRILRDRGLAEDAVQQALLDMWQDLPGLRDQDRFDAWSMRVLVRVSYAIAKRRRHHLLDVDALPVPMGTAEAGYLAVVQRDQLERGFARLPVEQRAAIVLHHYLGLPVREVASVLGAREETVRTRLRRGMTTLRTALGADQASTAPSGATGGLMR